MTNKTKLELTWIGKENRPRLEPRILLEDTAKSYHAPRRVSEDDLFDNRLIKGDNLLALKALEQEFTGKIKCICIDPPYNTGSAFAHYDDGIEHSLWLCLMRDRLEMFRSLLAEDGSVWIFVDDNEVHYLKVMSDEIFGRANFVTNVIWQKKYAPANDSKWLSESHDHVLVYARNKEAWRPNKQTRSDAMNAAYKNPDDDPRGVWKAGNYTCNKSSVERPSLYYAIRQPYLNLEVWPQKTRVWAYSQERHEYNVADNRVWWGKDGKNTVPSYKRFLSEVEGAVAQTVWTWEEVGHTQDAKKEQIDLNSSDPFATPKPERVIERILQLASNPGDWVLDSFAGSGTTGAVAHKMGRKWIMVELGEHCDTHILPRLRKVIDGTDKGGITESVCWRGGGGFRYYNLASSLLEKDRWGQWVISQKYNLEMLVEALCKLKGFMYAPSDDVYWQMGRSTETDYLYVVPHSLTAEQLQELSDDVGMGRSLLVLCKSFSGDPERWENLTVEKIPKHILDSCEWGHDDYSLRVENLPGPPPPPMPVQQTLDIVGGDSR